METIRHSEFDTYPSLAPGAPFTGTTVGGKTVTEQEVLDIVAGKLHYFHYVRGTYEDSAGTSYEFNFCVMCWPEWDSKMRIAPLEYWPKETLRNSALGGGDLTQPKWTDYTEDYFYGAIWGWKYRPEMGDKEPRDITGWCPECTQPHPLRQRNEVIIDKDNTRIAHVYCGKHIQKTYYVRTPSRLALDGIQEMIREKLQNGTWRDVVIQQRKARSGEA